MNLLSNAIKYTPENGDVKLEVYEEKLAESGKVRLVPVVSDTGIGMTPEFMEQMYSAFSRAVDTRVNKVRGSGLGLAIVKKIVDLMGGAHDRRMRPHGERERIKEKGSRKQCFREPFCDIYCLSPPNIEI